MSDKHDIARAALAQAASHMQRQAQTYADHQRDRDAAERQRRASVNNAPALGVIGNRLQQHYSTMTDTSR